MIDRIIKPVFFNDQKRTAGFYSPCNKMYNLQLLLDNRIRFNPQMVHEDYYFNLEVFCRCSRIVGITDILYFYFVQQGRKSLSQRIHAGINYIEWRNSYFIKNFPEISKKTKKYAREVYKWFVAHRKTILNSKLSSDHKQELIQQMDLSDLYKWVLLRTGFTKKRTERLANKKSVISRIKIFIKGFLYK